MSNKVYFQRPLAPDELLGHVAYDGRVYESRFGPDKYVGRVELDTGKIYEARLGPDKYTGQPTNMWARSSRWPPTPTAARRFCY